LHLQEWIFAPPSIRTRQEPTNDRRDSRSPVVSKDRYTKGRQVTTKDQTSATGLSTTMSLDEIKAGVLKMAQPADQALADNLKSHVSYIEKVSDYIIFSGGKRLRPVLFMLAAHAAGAKKPEPALASIFEFLHAATLLHDDVVDAAGLRRGRPAARTKYGNDAVILVGDFLFSKSYSLAADTGIPSFVKALTDCTTYMAEGQVLELLHTGDLKLDMEGYLEIIRAKTAVLLAASCQMGAIYAKADQDLIQAFYDYGMELGLAFQMVDDALDYVGTEHEFGKPVGHDLAEGKITLPFIHVRDNAPKEASQRLLKLAELGKTQPEVLEEAKSLVREHKGVEITYKKATEHAIKAQDSLQAVLSTQKDNHHLGLLYSLAWYVLNRRA
jgi:octaprenyl-diphosphate synthase